MDKIARDKNALKCGELIKDFGEHKGIFDVSFSLEYGSVTGFVGPNGAGKSTTINVLTGLTKASSGFLEIFTHQYSHADFYKFARQVGVMYSELTLDQGKTAKEVFTQSQEILGKDYTQQWQDMSALLELDLYKPIERLSLGNKKKVGIVHALLHQPDLIIMDEPTSGLDPIIRERFAVLIKESAARGASVLLSSHDLGEIQEIADTIIMIKDGKVVLNSQTDKILNLANRTFQLVRPPRQLVNKLEALKGVSVVINTPKLFSFQTKEYEQVTKLLNSENFYNFYIEKPNLEDSFKEYYE